MLFPEDPMDEIRKNIEREKKFRKAQDETISRISKETSYHIELLDSMTNPVAYIPPPRYSTPPTKYYHYSDMDEWGDRFNIGSKYYGAAPHLMKRVPK